MSSPSTFSPSAVSIGAAMILDLDEMSDIECGQPEQDLYLAGFDLEEDYAKEAILSAQANDDDEDDEKHALFAENALDDSDDVTLVPVPMPNDDRVYIYKAKMQEAYDGVVPDYNYAHSSTRMFGKRCSSFRYPSFEFWRRQYDMCRFNIVTLLDDDYNQWVDAHVLHENIEMKYICPHKTRSRHATDRCRVRPVCCDAYNRSCCWVDMSMTFHGSHGILSCGTIGANAPVPSFNVDCASLHPITRTREYFHCGTSFGYPINECRQIDERDCTELAFAFGLLRCLSEFLPPVWCEIMKMLNPYEKMIFASMMHDGNAVDDYVHQLRCNRLYGCNVRTDEHSVFPGHEQPPVNSNAALHKMMNHRRNSPCQQLMRYGGAYDLTNMLNRQAIRVEIVSEWRYLLLDMGRVMLHHLRNCCPCDDCSWTMCSHEEKTRYLDVWRATLRYLKVMSFPFIKPDKESLHFMMFEFDDIIRHFIDSDGLFSYLMSNNSVIRLASCADISDITWMAWEEAHDVRTMMNLKDWNSGFRTLLCQTFMFLEVDMNAIYDIAFIGMLNADVDAELVDCADHVNWCGSLRRIVQPIIEFTNLHYPRD